jgi:hypothetical protein
LCSDGIFSAESGYEGSINLKSEKDAEIVREKITKENIGLYTIFSIQRYNVNDYIDSKLCSVQYTEFEAAVQMVQHLDKGGFIS